MILTDEQMRMIIDRVLATTAEERLVWHLLDHGKLSAMLANRTKVELVPGEHSFDYILTLSDDAGIVVGQVKESPEGADPNSLALRKLYELAFPLAGKSVYRDIIDALNFTGSATATVTRPPQVTDEQARAVLNKMAGDWDLDFTRGKERVTIHNDGRYIIGNTPLPRFQLKVLAWNEDKRTAEVAKDFFNTGKRLQIEFLEISADTMVGHAKHDLHKLFYKRVTK